MDSGQHAEREKQDKNRIVFLESQVCRVIRFWNHELLENMPGVTDRILEKLQK